MDAGASSTPADVAALQRGPDAANMADDEKEEGDEEEEGEEEETNEPDLTPGLESLSVPFAEALLASPEMLTQVAAKTQKGVQDKLVRPLRALEQLGLSPEAFSDDTLRDGLERYVAAAYLAPDNCAALECIFASGRSLHAPITEATRICDVKRAIARKQGVPSDHVQLETSTGLVQDDLLVEGVVDGPVSIIITHRMLAVGNRVRAYWSSGDTTKAETFEENSYKGAISVVHGADGEKLAYDIDWDDNSKSKKVCCNGPVWRTGFGGIIYSLHAI